MAQQTQAAVFTEFMAEHGPGIRQSLVAALGPDLGRDAAAEALAYGWEHWDRVSEMVNPMGYLYRVGRDRGRRMRPRTGVVLPSVPAEHEPWIEPMLPAVLAELPERQRVVISLLHGYEWTMSEVADLLGVSKSTVQNHADRAMRKIRKRLGAGT